MSLCYSWLLSESEFFTKVDPIFLMKYRVFLLAHWSKTYNRVGPKTGRILMSRSGYTDDYDDYGTMNLYRATVD